MRLPPLAPLALLLASAAVSAACGQSSEPGPAEAGAGGRARPNVLFLVVDDLNTWVGCMDRPAVRTPNIDRLARRGVLFTRAYAAAPSCNPSRTAFLTGVPPHVSGVYYNNQDWRPKIAGIAGAATLPEHFKANGYRSVGAGKIFHKFFEHDAAWDEFFGGGTTPLPAPESRPLFGLAGLERLEWAPMQAPEEEMRDSRVATWAAERLAAAADEDQPLFLAAGIFRPHLPWIVPQADLDRYPIEAVELPKVPEGDLDDLPASGRAYADTALQHAVVQHGKWKELVRAYQASITFADRCVGRILDALDASGRADDTIVVLASDHGWHLGEKQHWRKFALWERTLRVPLVVVAPGITPAGAVCDRPVGLMDLYPTLIDLCGLPARDVEGDSLRPLLEDPAAAWPHVVLSTHSPGNYSACDGRYRYIRYADGGEELYDHHADPDEWVNLAGAAEHARRKAQLAVHLPQEAAEDDAPEGSR